MDNLEIPIVFISYSWTSPDHEAWVMNLAERLGSDQVKVVIDKYDLKPGHDKFHFMETMVKSEEIQKVLIILDKKYSEKAEKRSGGVGTETQIISPKIYSDVSQDKFIPIVSENDENGKAYLPTFLEGRIYIDLSDQDNFEEKYEELLRLIFNRPAYRRPKLGKAPSYLFEESPLTHNTSSIVRSFENVMNKNPKRINSVLRDFLDEFFDNLKEYKAIISSRDIYTWGKGIYDCINSYTPLRNDYINFVDKILKSEVDFDIELFIRFFEKLPLLKHPQDDRSGGWSPNEFDNFRFFIHEIFLYTIAVGLKNEKYSFVEDLLYSSYFFQDKYNYKNEPQRFDKLYNYVEIFDQYYKQAFSQDFFSPMADLLIKRIPDGLGKDNLIDADLLCHYISELENLDWFPVTYVYRTRGKFELFDRLISQRHFDKVKVLFNVSSPKELQEKINKLKDTEKFPGGVSYSRGSGRVVPLYNLVNLDKIGTVR